MQYAKIMGFIFSCTTASVILTFRQSVDDCQPPLIRNKMQKETIANELEALEDFTVDKFNRMLNFGLAFADSIHFIYDFIVILMILITTLAVIIFFQLYRLRQLEEKFNKRKHLDKRMELVLNSPNTF